MDMKKTFICLIMALGAMTLYAKDIKQLTLTTTPKMSCQNCENKIKGNLRFEKGIKKVETSLADQTVTVTYDAEKTDEAKISQAFEKLNYKVSKLNGQNGEAKSCCKSGATCSKSENEASVKCDGTSESCCKNKKN